MKGRSKVEQMDAAAIRQVRAANGALVKWLECAWTYTKPGNGAIEFPDSPIADPCEEYETMPRFVGVDRAIWKKRPNKHEYVRSGIIKRKARTKVRGAARMARIKVLKTA